VELTAPGAKTPTAALTGISGDLETCAMHVERAGKLFFDIL